MPEEILFTTAFAILVECSPVAAIGKDEGVKIDARKKVYQCKEGAEVLLRS